MSWKDYARHIGYAAGMSTSDNLIPDQVQAAIDFAEFAMAKEKRDRIGHSEATVYPMKFFFFHDGTRILGLMGSPVGTDDLDENAVMAVVARLFAIALDAKAVLHVTEGWSADRCGKCGVSFEQTKDERCGVCGTETVPPSENPYREELLMSTLSIKGLDKSYVWTSRFERDGDGKIVGFDDRYKCEPLEGSGRFMELWKVEPWMAPQFAANIPLVLEALGKKVEKRHIEVARAAVKMAPPGYKFIKFKVEDLMAVISRMEMKEKAEGN
jgi:hypothetical protein